MSIAQNSMPSFLGTFCIDFGLIKDASGSHWLDEALVPPIPLSQFSSNIREVNYF
jgi:hypothetical protein